MLRTIFATIALVSSYGFACAEVSRSALTSAKPQVDAYESCVVGRAKSFAGSPDSTESIIKGAIAACIAEQRALTDALGLAGVSSGEADDVLKALDKQLFQAASQAVLEERTSH